jgi:exonuclease VII small subunit
MTPARQVRKQATLVARMAEDALEEALQEWRRGRTPQAAVRLKAAEVALDKAWARADALVHGVEDCPSCGGKGYHVLAAVGMYEPPCERDCTTCDGCGEVVP